MQLYSYSDTGSQGIHLGPNFLPNFILAPSDFETQPIWLEISFAFVAADACKVLDIGSDAFKCLAVRQDASRTLDIDPDAFRCLRISICETP